MSKYIIIILQISVWFVGQSIQNESAEEKQSSSSSEHFMPQIPPECEELGICDKVPNYPRELADRLIEQYGEELRGMHGDTLEPDSIKDHKISRRSIRKIKLCNITEVMFYPEAAKSTDHKWYYLLQHKEYPVQGFNMMICERENGACNSDVMYFKSGYSGYCKQNYIVRRAHGIDVQKGTILFGLPIYLPSCCSCVGISKPGLEADEEQQCLAPQPFPSLTEQVPCTSETERDRSAQILNVHCTSSPTLTFQYIQAEFGHQMISPSAVWVKRCVGICDDVHAMCVPTKRKEKIISARIYDLKTNKESCARFSVEEHVSCSCCTKLIDYDDDDEKDHNHYGYE